MNRARAAIGLALLAAAWGGAPEVARADVTAQPRTPGDVSPLPVLAPAPDFALWSLEGPGVRLRELRGKLVALAFACASCSDEPEDVAAGFARIQARLKARGLFGGRVVLVFVVRHPERETRAGFRAYAARLGVDPYGWAILSGSTETTRGLREAFGRIGVPPGGPPADPTARVFLVDYAGRVRRVYDGARFDADAVLRDMELLL